jgi:hypothetical protein
MVATQAAAWPEVAAFVDSGQTSAVVPVVVLLLLACLLPPIRGVTAYASTQRVMQSPWRARAGLANFGDGSMLSR